MYNWRMVALKYGNLPPNANFILLYLSTYMNQRGDSCYPSVITIAGETGLTKPTVIKYLNVLREKGWIISKSIGKGHGWSHNQYYPMLPDNAVKEINRLNERGKTDSITRLNSSSNAVKELNPIYPLSIQEQSTGTSSQQVESDQPAARVPYKKIVDLYHELLPASPKVKVLTPRRKSFIKQRHFQDMESDLETWCDYFRMVGRSEFLTGRRQPSNGRPVFVADLEWITKQGNFVKIYEGKYHGK